MLYDVGHKTIAVAVTLRRFRFAIIIGGSVVVAGSVTYFAVCWQVFWRTPVIEASEHDITPTDVIRLAEAKMEPKLRPEPFSWTNAKYFLRHPTEAGPRQIPLVRASDENGETYFDLLTYGYPRGGSIESIDGKWAWRAHY